MMWAMMWATGTMAATILATTPEKGMAGMPEGRGGEAPGGGCGGGSGSGGGGGGGSSNGNDGGCGCILQGLFAFYCEDILCGIFMMCGGNWQGHTSHTSILLLQTPQTEADAILKHASK
jgi:hypothetical protein